MQTQQLLSDLSPAEYKDLVGKIASDKKVQRTYSMIFENELEDQSIRKELAIWLSVNSFSDTRGDQFICKTRGFSEWVKKAWLHELQQFDSSGENKARIAASFLCVYEERLEEEHGVKLPRMRDNIRSFTDDYNKELKARSSEFFIDAESQLAYDFVQAIEKAFGDEFHRKLASDLMPQVTLNFEVTSATSTDRHTEQLLSTNDPL